MLKEPKLRIDYDELIISMERRLVRGGMMRPRKEAEIEDDINVRVEAYRDIFRQYLEDDWYNLFPEIDFNEDLLERELDLFLEKKRKETLSEFKKKAEVLRKFKAFFGLFFISEQIYLIFSMVISLAFLPYVMSLMFKDSDWALYGGFFIVICLISTVGFFGYRYSKIMRRVKSSMLY